MLKSAALCRLLGDDGRLRLLRLVMNERLNVSELTAILGIAQSGVSRHLGMLREAGLVREDREGGFTFYSGADDDKGAKLSTIWPSLEAQLAAEGGAGLRVLRGDDARLHEVVRQRREHRDTHGGVSRGDRQLVPGRSWVAWSRALGLLLPGLMVADVGCGDGHLTMEMAVWSAHVLGVDRSREVLRRARALAKKRRVSNVEWKQGEIEDIPLSDNTLDLVVLSQALHHARVPERALTEAARVIKPSGRVLILDLVEHDQAWVADRLGDRWLGFCRERLATLMVGAGLTNIRVETGLDENPFGVVVAVGMKPASAGRSRRRE
jgi:2-polyprenyl-3-methyl-5-hydroxy-6-metoxy-1,4-benzoquinol methylase